MNAEEYAIECRKFDNLPYVYNEENVSTQTWNRDNLGHVRFREYLYSQDTALASGSFHMVEISCLTLCLRGRANQKIELHKDESSDENCWVQKYELSETSGKRKGILLLRVDGIYAIQVLGRLEHLCLFGPRWAGKKVKSCFDLHEVRAVKDWKGAGVLPIERVGLAVKLVHKHNIHRNDSVSTWQNMTDSSKHLTAHEVCRFAFACTRHDRSEEDQKTEFCRDCMQEIDNKRGDPGTETFVTYTVLVL